MSDLEIRLQQIMTMLQKSVMDEHHPLGRIFRTLGELQSNGEKIQDGGLSDQETLGQYQKQLAALDLDEGTKSELRSAFAEAANEGPGAPSAGLNEQILTDLLNQLNHIQSLIRDPNVDPAAALAMIRPFYEEASSVIRNVAGSFNLNPNTILNSLQALLRNQSR